MTHDVKLVRQVHREERSGFLIIATLTRFGGLAVFVHLHDMSMGWQGDNILEARDWVDVFVDCHQEDAA
jgi:hypothetical protein